MKHLILSVIIAFISFNGLAQKPYGKYDSFSDRVFYGGTFGLNIGSRITQIDIQPLGGLWVIPQWNIGVSSRYSYRNERFNLVQGTSKANKNHIWGVSCFTQVLPIPDCYEAFGVDIHGGFMFHCEYECMYIDKKFVNISENKGKQWVNICFLGGGWRQRVGDRSAVNIMVLWDISSNTYSPYIDNPVIRFCITF